MTAVLHPFRPALERKLARKAAPILAQMSDEQRERAFVRLYGSLDVPQRLRVVHGPACLDCLRPRGA